MRAQDFAYLWLMSASVFSTILLWLSRASGIGYRCQHPDREAEQAATARKEAEMDDRLMQILRDNRRLMS